MTPSSIWLNGGLALPVGSRECPSILSVERSRTDPELAKRVAIYRSQLRQLPPKELEELVGTEREKQRAELVAKAERDEQERFFNQPYATADFAHWSKAAHWTLDEAIALSFGKAPEVVNWEKVKPYAGTSPLAFQYQRRRDLALRAVTWQQLFDPVLPGIFLAWAKRTDLAVAPELELAVTARGVQVADWKKLYDDLNAKFVEHHKGWMKLSEEQSELIYRAQVRIAELEARLASAATPSPSAVPQKSLGTRERESLLKLIIGMAISGYGYDPSAPRSTQPSNIESDLANQGLALDVDTIRKWLKEASQLLPRSETR